MATMFLALALAFQRIYAFSSSRNKTVFSLFLRFAFYFLLSHVSETVPKCIGKSVRTINFQRLENTGKQLMRVLMGRWSRLYPTVALSNSWIQVIPASIKCTKTERMPHHHQTITCHFCSVSAAFSCL